VREQQNLFNASVVLIEDKASGTQLIQELVAEGGHGVTRYQPTGDKTMRMHAQTAMIENGFVHIPETAPWLAEYLHELTGFPNGKHDDQADSTAQFLDWFKMPFPGRGIFELYACRPSNCDAGRAPGSACWRHPASAPCKSSQADTSMSASTAPSNCRPKMPNTISATAGPNSQNGQPRTRFDRMSPHQSVPVCTARRWYRRFRRAPRRLQG
jgi:hypothetical protein